MFPSYTLVQPAVINLPQWLTMSWEKRRNIRIREGSSDTTPNTVRAEALNTLKVAGFELSLRGISQEEPQKQDAVRQARS